MGPILAPIAILDRSAACEAVGSQIAQLAAGAAPKRSQKP